MAEKERGNLDAAIAHLERSLAIREAIGDRAGMASVLGFIGALRRRTGCLTEARACLERSLALSRELSIHRSTIFACSELGMLMVIESKNMAEAARDAHRAEGRRYVDEAIDICRSLDKMSLIETIERDFEEVGNT